MLRFRKYLGTILRGIGENIEEEGHLEDKEKKTHKEEDRPRYLG